MLVKYRERIIHGYKAWDRTITFNADSYFIPDGTNLYYFKVNEFRYVTVGAEDLISIEE